ncbi:MAG: hypothetical protein FWE23_11390, partial [Chitinivibrionia bacterium]|nr:hypothetical protein [Chitinivibrionia bacterium]
MELSKNTNVFQRNKQKFIILLLAIAVATAMANTATGGGAVGVNFGTIENSYSTGSIWVNSLSAQSTIGGLVGQNQGGTITNSFFDSQRSGRNDNDGRGTPLTTEQMRQQATFAQWNLHSIWRMDAQMYNGEPFLRAFYPLIHAQFTIEGQRATVSPASSIFVLPYTGIMLHTGSPIQPTVQIEYNGQSLTLDTDFRLEFENNTNANNTTPARMRIIGMGDYAGITLGYNFFITNQRGITLGNVSAIPNQTHTGTPIRPDVVIRDFNNTVILQEGVDYELNYTNNTNIGTATIEIIGIGDIYTGFRTVNFSIVPPVDTYQINAQNTTISGIPTSVAFNGQAHIPSITVNHTPHGLLVENEH